LREREDDPMVSSQETGSAKRRGRHSQGKARGKWKIKGQGNFFRQRKNSVW